MDLSIHIQNSTGWDVVQIRIGFALRHGLQVSGMHLINQWARSVPKRTGHTSRSGTTDMGPGRFEARFGSNQVSARVLEYGARVHPIRPRRRKVLSWKAGSGSSTYTWRKTKALPGTEKSGHRVERTHTVRERRQVARYVRHPGVKPGHYLMLAALDNDAAVHEIIARSIRRRLA